MKEPHDGRYHLPPCPPELVGTFEGTEYEHLRRMAAMSFQERLEWIDETLALREELDDARRALQDGGAD